jgi:cell wall-associated NlpC family hydrolase
VPLTRLVVAAYLLVTALAGWHSASAPPPHAPARPPSTTTPHTVTPQPALIAVSVANVWVTRHKARTVDQPALQKPARVDRWLASMTLRQRRGLDTRLATQVRYGDEVDVRRVVGPWTSVEIPEQTGKSFPGGIRGWVASRQLVRVPAGWTTHARVATVTATTARLDQWRDGRSHALRVSYATSLPVLAVRPHTVVVAVPGAAASARLSRADVNVHRVGTAAIPASQHRVVQQAGRFLGLPYLWAGTSAWGFDCSGLVETVYGEMGVALPRDAADQSTVGTPIARRNLRPGDLVFLSSNNRRDSIHHVAIYVGHGRVIHAPYTGAPIERTSLWHSYLAAEYWGATRPLSTT